MKWLARIGVRLIDWALRRLGLDQNGVPVDARCPANPFWYDCATLPCADCPEVEERIDNALDRAAEHLPSESLTASRIKSGLARRGSGWSEEVADAVDAALGGSPSDETLAERSERLGLARRGPS